VAGGGPVAGGRHVVVLVVAGDHDDRHVVVPAVVLVETEAVVVETDTVIEAHTVIGETDTLIVEAEEVPEKCVVADAGLIARVVLHCRLGSGYRQEKRTGGNCACEDCFEQL
jgi:hypothetical protein